MSARNKGRYGSHLPSCLHLYLHHYFTFISDEHCSPLVDCWLRIPKVQFYQQLLYVRFISYSKCFNWHRILKLSSNFGCLFTFCYLDGINSIKTDLHTIRHTLALITRDLYTFYPLFELHLCTVTFGLVWIVFKSGF